MRKDLKQVKELLMSSVAETEGSALKSLYGRGCLESTRSSMEARVAGAK